MLEFEARAYEVALQYFANVCVCCYPEGAVSYSGVAMLLIDCNRVLN